MTPNQAATEMEDAASSIKEIVEKCKDDLSHNNYTYFQRSFNMKHWIPQLYGAPKLHKKKINGQYQFRLILSKYGSLLEIASKWIDVQLQSIEIKTRLKDVFKILHELEKVKLQLNTEYCLVSANAISMCTNMDIQDILETLEKIF